MPASTRRIGNFNSLSGGASFHILGSVPYTDAGHSRANWAPHLKSHVKSHLKSHVPHLKSHLKSHVLHADTQSQ
jgi:hypothetical protein